MMARAKYLAPILAGGWMIGMLFLGTGCATTPADIAAQAQGGSPAITERVVVRTDQLMPADAAGPGEEEDAEEEDAAVKPSEPRDEPRRKSSPASARKERIGSERMIVCSLLIPSRLSRRSSSAVR